MASASDYNAAIIQEFRATGGHPGGEWAGTPMILIHHIGAKSGIERVTPLGCLPLGDGRFAVVASSGGSPAHPAWYHNLLAHPVISVEEAPDVHRGGGGAGSRRPGRAVADAGREVPHRRQIPGQHHPADPGIHPDPPGLRRSFRTVSWRLRSRDSRRTIRNTPFRAGRCTQNNATGRLADEDDDSVARAAIGNEERDRLNAALAYPALPAGQPPRRPDLASKLKPDRSRPTSPHR